MIESMLRVQVVTTVLIPRFSRFPRFPRIALIALIALVVCAAGGCGGTRVAAWPESSEGEVCLVEVTGSGFEWIFRYPGGDGRFGTVDDLVSSRVLHLPRGRRVDLKLTSTDYIYTWTLPELELEEIAVPELVHTLRVEAERVGSYRLLADPMCAIRFSHDEDMGRMQIDELSVFEDWLATLAR